MILSKLFFCPSCVGRVEGGLQERVQYVGVKRVVQEDEVNDKEMTGPNITVLTFICYH